MRGDTVERFTKVLFVITLVVMCVAVLAVCVIGSYAAVKFFVS